MSWFDSADNQTAATAPHAEVTTFVELDLPSGYVRLHTRTGTIQWGSGSPVPSWIGVGKLGTIDVVKEDTELRPNTIQLTLSGVDADLVNSAITQKYHGRSVSIYDGFLNTETLQLVATPELRFRGVMDYMTVSLEANGGAITVSCESEFARWQRPRSLLYTHESQQLLYEGDRGFDMVPTIQSRVIDWTKRGTVFSQVGRVIKTTTPK